MYRTERAAQRARRDAMTLEEYLRTPESSQPQELIYGALRVADAPLAPHQRAVGRLFRALDDHVTARCLGEVWLSPIDVILDAERALVLQPDLLFVSNARQYLVTDRIGGAPDLVVEVLSPFPRIGRLDERIGWFAKYGVDECWIVHLDTRCAELLTLTPGGVQERRVFERQTPIESQVLPAFAQTLGSILGW